MIEHLKDAAQRLCAERSFTLAEIEMPHDRDAVKLQFSYGEEIVAVVEVSGLEIRSVPLSGLPDLLDAKLDDVLYGAAGDAQDEAEEDEEEDEYE